MKIGTIVSFKSHPFVDESTSILISGEHLMLAPLMVVAEILNIIKDEHSESDGTPIAKRGNCHCKCIWFSSKTNQFEETWFYSIQLNVITEVEESSIAQESLSYLANHFMGKLVAFKTLNLEVGKQKSSLNTESGRDSSREKTTISSLLSFASPIMQVLDVKENDNKDLKYDVKTGNQKKFLPKYNVKCKWYNPSGDKFSEKILPIDVLLLLPILNSSKLKLIQQYISGVATILKLKNSLVKPLSLSYRSGYYYLGHFDFVLNVNDEIKVSDDTVLATEPDLYIKESPDFKLIASHSGAEWKLSTTIKDVLNDCITEQNYLRIIYKDSAEKTTTRTLKDLLLHTVLEAPESYPTATEPVTYIEGYCYLRKAKRYFKVDRIQKAQQMNLKYTL